jgi:hypothetical protein
MNEQILKRLQDTMKLFSVCIEQLEALCWSVHDIIEDLELELQAPKVIEASKGDVATT